MRPWRAGCTETLAEVLLPAIQQALQTLTHGRWRANQGIPRLHRRCQHFNNQLSHLGISEGAGLMAMAMATLPGQFGEIGMTSKHGAGLSRGILLQERDNVELGCPWIAPKHHLKGGLSWLLFRTKTDLFKATRGCQGGVRPTIGDISTKG